MRPAAGEVQAAEPPVAVRLAEVRRLVQRRLDGERVAPHGAELAGEVQRRHAVLGDDRVADPDQPEARLHVGQQRVAQPVAVAVPVEPGAQVRHGQQHGERVAARRGHRRLGARGRVDVGGERARQLAAARDRADELAVAVARPAACGAGARPSAGPCRGRAGSRTSSRAAGGAARAARPARGCAARRRSTRPRRRRSAPRPRADAGHAAAGVLDRRDRLAAAHVERRGHRLDHRVGPALGVPAAVEDLQVDERRVDRGHAVGVAADEQRVERERLPHARVLEPARDERVQRPQGVEPHHVGHEAREVQRGRERPPPRGEDAALVDRLERREERLDAARVARGELRHLCAQHGDVGREVEVLAPAAQRIR